MTLRRLLYTLFLYFIFPLVLIRLLWRSRTNKAYRLRWSERLGFISRSAKNINNNSMLWVHAVSVGEVIAAKPLILALMEEFPGHKLLLTTTTPTGSDRVSNIFSDQINDQRLIHVYFPYDLLGSVSRFIQAFMPKILIVVETEIWPNLYAKCYQKNIPVLMVNARLSDKSMKSYLKISSLIAETLSKVNSIAVRSSKDAERFSALGADPKQIVTMGNIKYDLKIDQTQVDNAAAYQHATKYRPVLVAASTHLGEDKKIVVAYLSLLKNFPELLLVLVPRHPERFNDVYADCRKQIPENLKIIRHSEYKQTATNQNSVFNVVIGDSMGEMQMWYSLASLVFIGGSLVKTGGHNPLEATIFGVPVFSGPHMFNFEDIASELKTSELLTICEDEFDLVEQTSTLLERLVTPDDEKVQKGLFQNKADLFMQQHRGVTARLVAIISKSLA